MLDKTLKTWIAESESWQSFIDFDLPEDAIADYSFVKNPDDFYISLMSEAFDLFNEPNFTETDDALLAIAKGLEVYSLENKRKFFEGVNYGDNLLYVAGLYYLAGYAASALILSNLLPPTHYDSEIDTFISSFLRRIFLKDNRYSLLLYSYLSSGDVNQLNELSQAINEHKEKAFNEDFNSYASFKLAAAMVRKFECDNLWIDLLIYNEREHWRGYITESLNKKLPIWSFFPSQKEALSKGIFQDGCTCALQMPTSAGKTAISELVIYDECKKNPCCKILYLAPFRALASELKFSIARNLSILNISSKTIYGGNFPTTEEKASISKVNLLIATPEKFMAIEDVLPGIFEEFTTIICDEGHLLDDASRGLSYELLLSRLKASGVVNRRFIFISAIIPNISTINSWLGGNDDSLVSSNYRPTQLEYAFLKRMSGKAKAYYIDVNPTKSRPERYQLYKYLSGDELKLFSPETEKHRAITSKRGISVAAALKAINSGSVAIFAPHKRGVSGVEDLVVEAMTQILGRVNKKNPINFANEIKVHSLEEYFIAIFGKDYLLTQIVKHGVLFHHADLPQSVREIIEDALREEDIHMVICTNTLAEGVNLPIRTMVLHSTKRFNAELPKWQAWQPLKVRDLINLVGRAGRAGKETKGMILVPHEDDFNLITKVINDRENELVKGRLYYITKRITENLKGKRLSNELLDAQSEQFKQLLDSIETSIIDLLAEEVNIEELKEMVASLIQETLTYYQSNDAEKRTLSDLISLRSEKLIPFIENKEFYNLKHSGTNIRLYNEIMEVFDFKSTVWDAEIETFDQDWMCYVFNEGIFKLSTLKYELDQFNNQKGTEITLEKLSKVIELWMQENWYHDIASELELEIFRVLRLLISIVGFNVSNMMSKVIRIKELTDTKFETPASIANWPSYLKHGLNSQLQLDIVELGLIERLAVIALNQYLMETSYHHVDYKGLKKHLYSNKNNILKNLHGKVPKISFNKIESMLELLRFRNIY